MFQGKALKVTLLPDGIAELTFDLQGESVNKFNLLAVAELQVHPLHAVRPGVVLGDAMDGGQAAHAAERRPPAPRGARRRQGAVPDIMGGCDNRIIKREC